MADFSTPPDDKMLGWLVGVEHAGDAEDWLDKPLKAAPGVYALRVHGNSMVNPAGRTSYPDGCIVFVDPNKRTPVNGARIIAKVEGNGDVCFRVYTEEAGRVYLAPLNPAFESTFEPFKVLGTVIYKGEPE